MLLTHAHARCNQRLLSVAAVAADLTFGCSLLLPHGCSLCPLRTNACWLLAAGDWLFVAEGWQLADGLTQLLLNAASISVCLRMSACCHCIVVLAQLLTAAIVVSYCWLLLCYRRCRCGLDGWLQLASAAGCSPCPLRAAACLLLLLSLFLLTMLLTPGIAGSGRVLFRQRPGCARELLGSCPRSGREMPGRCPRGAREVPERCPRGAREVPRRCPRNGFWSSGGRRRANKKQTDKPRDTV